MPRCTRNISAICQPTGKTGFRDDRASWKIIEISGPLILRRSTVFRVSRSRPRKRIFPEGILAGGMSRMPMMACAVTDFPDPDSPRMASVSPWSRWRSTPLIALAIPSSVWNST
jgi:hypothetical protein